MARRSKGFLAPRAIAAAFAPVAPLVVTALAATISFAPRTAHAADIHELAERVAAQWRDAGAHVTTLPPKFLFDDETTKILMPPSGLPGLSGRPGASAASGSAGGSGACVTIGLIGARGMSFHVKIAGTVEDPLDDDQTNHAASVAGVVELVRCGKQADRIVVTNDAGRGAIEMIVAESATPISALSLVLLERTGGSSLLPNEVGAPLPLPPFDERAKRADARSLAEGGAQRPHLATTSESDGSGEVPIALEPACHVLDIFADASKRARRLDVDAELRDDEGTVLARDRSEAADAHLFVCVGESVETSLAFVGAPARAKVVVAHSTFALSPVLPRTWGASPRARMASALHSRHLPTPEEKPVFLAQGASGDSALTVPVLPASCYVAIAAVTNGHPRGLGLRVTVGRTEANDDRAPGDEAGAVAFCTTTERVARVGIDARGAGVSWGLALFRVLVRKATP